MHSVFSHLKFFFIHREKEDVPHFEQEVRVLNKITIKCVELEDFSGNIFFRFHEVFSFPAFHVPFQFQAKL